MSITNMSKNIELSGREYYSELQKKYLTSNCQIILVRMINLTIYVIEFSTLDSYLTI